MAQRLNKKLLLGLGSTLGFLGTGVVSGFGINAIVSNASNFNQDQLALNTLSETDFKAVPDYNVATRDMFIDTNGLKRFHFGDTQKGQTVTPYGWLGVFEDSTTVQNRIALIGWNGEILWVNEDYKNQNTSDYNVYEMKYDFNTNLIFVLRSSSKNGLVDDNPGSLDLASVQLDILDAATGQKIINGGDAIDANEFIKFQQSALNAIQSFFLKINNLGGKKPITNLFQLDIASVSDTKVLVTWMPNFMLLKDLNYQTFPNFRNIVDYFNKITKSFVFEKVSPTNVKKNIKSFNLRGSNSEFSSAFSSPNWVRFFGNEIDSADLNDYVLLANPFFTTVGDDKLILHLIVAKSRNITNNGQETEITHKTVGFAESNERHLGFDYDKSEQIGGIQINNNNSYFNFLNVDSTLNGNTAAWSRANTFGADFINANLRINRNLFDNNSVVFAYPYAAQTSQNVRKNNFPIFNVAQLSINSNNGLIDKNKSINYDFGKQIYDAWIKNNAVKTKPFPNISYNGQQFTNLQHNYNRLINVSPFDNTIIYASRPSFDNFLADDSKKNDWAGFWVAKSGNNNKPQYRPLVLQNINNIFDSAIIGDINAIYNEGFIFDLNSLNSVGTKDRLNLYFNQSGSGRNAFHWILPENKKALFRSSKIGLLDDVLSFKDNGWLNDIISSPKANFQDYQAIITNDSFANLITSHADLTRWYPKTWQNLNRPGNLYQANEQINKNHQNEIRPLISNWNQINKSGLFNEQAGVDSYVNWLVGKSKASVNGTLQSNYNRLLIQQPVVRTRNESLPNNLPISLSYELKQDVIKKYQQKYQFNNAKAKQLNWTKNINIANSSVQFLSSWSTHDKLKSISSSTNSFTVKDNWEESKHVTWFDLRQQDKPQGITGSDYFGKISNAANINNHRPLRLMLRIVKPNNSPSWLNQADNQFFQWYPIGSEKLNTETTFDTVLNQFVDWKSKNINLDENVQAAFGLANLKIEAALMLNPLISSISNPNLYKFNNTKKIILANNDGKKYIYDDQYKGKRVIYDQSATEYEQLNQQGFGDQVRSALADSWVNVPSKTNKLVVKTNANLLPNTLVRKSSNDLSNPAFRAEYVEGSNRTKIKIRPVNNQDLNWFKGHFQKFNYALNLFIKFEYQKLNDQSGQWYSFNNKDYWTDKEIINLMNINNENAITIEANDKSIIKMRFRLITNPKNNNQNNNFVEYSGFSDNENKFISNGVFLVSTKIIFDSKWFDNEILSLADSNGSLKDLKKTDVERFEKAIFSKLEQSNNNLDLKKRIKFVYSFKNQSNLSNEQLVNSLISELTNYNSDEQGIFALWNGQNGNLKIKATMSLIDSNDPSFIITKPDGSIIVNEADRTANIKSNIKTSVDLSNYFEEIQKNPLKAFKGLQNGILTSFEIPKYQDGQQRQGQLFDKTYLQIEKIFDAVGVKFQFKEWDASANNGQSSWSAWKEKSAITKYNPGNPAIKIGLKIPSDWNIEIKFKDIVINDDWEKELKLHLPKLVKGNENIWNAFKKADPFSGNTFRLNITNTSQAEQILKEKLITFNNAQNSNNDFGQLKDQITIKYRFGNSGTFQNAEDLKQTLEKQNNVNQTSNQIWFQINLNSPNSQEPDFEFDETTVPSVQKLLEENNTKVKKFIHGDPFEVELNKIQAAGPNKGELSYTYPPNIQKIIDKKNEFSVLNLEWTFADGLDVNANTGTNSQIKWVNQELPTSVSDDVNQIFVRIANNQPDIYVYGPDENIPAKKKQGTIDLSQIAIIIDLDGDWLQQQFTNAEIDLENLKPNHFQNYEKLVWTKANLKPTLANQVKIAYSFDNKDYTNLNQLLQAIKDYQNQHIGDVNLGILQLWNNIDSGVKITTKFVKNNSNDSLHILKIKNENKFDLDLSKVITTIDFSAVLEWLKGQIIEIEGDENKQTINRLIIPNINNVTNNLFNNRSWDNVTKILNTFGLEIEYSNNLPGAPASWGSIDSVNRYDANKPSFQLHFKTDGSKSTNIKLQLSNDQFLDGKAVNTSKAEIIKIKARLLIEINSNFLNEFKDSAVFAGNTKNLDTSKVIDPTNQLIEKIINFNKANDSRFEELSNSNLLEVQYILQKQMPNENDSWKSLDELALYLQNETNDQPSNQIWYRINLKQSSKFNLKNEDVQPKILNNHQDPNVPEIKIKYYINEWQWENKADQIAINGTSDNLNWNFVDIFSDKVFEQGNQVYLRNSAGQALQVHFTLMQNANYQNPSDVSADLQHIKSKWVSIKPIKISPGEKNLKIRLVATPGFVYGPANKQALIAKAHSVKINVQNILRVDKSWLKEEIVTSSTEINNLKLINLTTWEDQIYEKIKKANNTDDEEIIRKVKIRYLFNNQKFTISQALLNEISKLLTNFQDEQTLGIVQLWNETSKQGMKLEAIFELDFADKQNYVLKALNQPGITTNNDLKELVKTNNVFTLISLTNYIKVLKEQKTTVNSDLDANPGEINDFEPPAMSGRIGEGFLNGQKFNKIVNRLNKVGIEVKFAQTASIIDSDWVAKNEIKKYNIQTSALFLSFEINTNAKNTKIQWNDTEQPLNPGENLRGNKAIKLQLVVPKYIIINSNAQFWLTKKEDFNFSGNTKHIKFNLNKIKEFVKQILEENFNASNDVSYKTAPLKIEFQVGNRDFVEIDQLTKYLEKQTDDLPDRTINFRFSIPNNLNQEWRLENPNQTYALLREITEDQTAINKLKIYINDKNIFNDLKETKLKGTSQNLIWEFINNLNVDDTDGTLKANNRGFGLKVEFTFNQNIKDNESTGSDVDTQWVNRMPKNFKSDQNKILLRLAVIDNNRYQYDYQHQRIELSLDEIVVFLNLKSEWLKLIKLTGTTKNLEIKEDEAKTKLINALPTNEPDLVQFEYSINEQEWKRKNDFMSLLIQKNGQKDANHFILKREEIKVCFVLDSNKINKFQMMIDDKFINLDNTNNPAEQLINDNISLNEDVRGVIELSHLKHFLLQNFRLEGTNNNLKLKITNKTAMDNLLQIYAANQLFDIEITGIFTNNTFDWTQAVSILRNGKFIDENDLTGLNFQIDANKKVALRFISKNQKYDIYYQNVKHDNGYELDISKNARITFEIENPFVKQSKTLSLWWTEDKSRTKGKYYQGEGGFKIINGTANNEPDLNNYKSSISWLKSAESGLTQKEQSVLEFVYHIYENQPDVDEIRRVGSRDVINDYDDSIWKPVADVLDENDQNDFTKPLGLKVGQFVSVALRVKKEYTTGEDIYTLKYDEHSFMSPIINNSNKNPGRAHGYKVKTSEVNIIKEQIQLENILDSEQDPLDGYTNIKRLLIEKDHLENYQGVNLKLELFHQFHKSNNGVEVLISPFDKTKLVKRSSENTTLNNDYFKDANGNYFLDENNKKIPILIDNQGKPTAPIMESDITISQNFVNYSNGIFGLNVPQNNIEKNKIGIFKNEKIEISFIANQGIGGSIDPDFILDREKKVNLQNEISPKIKFPILNPNNIKYKFNYEDFTKNKVEFENATDASIDPINGKSKIKTLVKLIKTTNASAEEQIIKADDINQTIITLKKELKNSFNDKLRFETIYEKIDGGNDIFDDLELYKLNNLKNNDRVKVKIVSADPNFIWAEPPKPLTINVSGLVSKAPNRNQLRFLRVEQSGHINGKGSFKVLINNPTENNVDANELLQGWKFVLRVWNSKEQIKYDWTSDQSKIVNLSNGDKVEWKLVDEFDNPVEDAYYNTIAGNHKFDSTNGTTELIFNQVIYPSGKDSTKVVYKGIGKYPKDPDQYPTDSGFVISGLKNEFELFDLNNNIFAKIIDQLESHYVGLNGQGTINFKADYLNKNYYVNSLGELYEKPLEQPIFKQQVDDGVVEISLADFLANTTFYTSDPNLINYQNGFKFLGNDTNLNNHLSNGDQVWAQFDLQADNNEVNRGISTELNPVTGLKDVVTDPMTPLWYILMAIAGIVSFGGLSLLMIWAKRNRKFKK